MKPAVSTLWSPTLVCIEGGGGPRQLWCWEVRAGGRGEGGWRRRHGRRLRQGALCAAVDTAGCRQSRASARQRWGGCSHSIAAPCAQLPAPGDSQRSSAETESCRETSLRKGVDLLHRFHGTEIFKHLLSSTSIKTKKVSVQLSPQFDSFAVCHDLHLSPNISFPSRVKSHIKGRTILIWGQLVLVLCLLPVKPFPVAFSDVLICSSDVQS